MNTVSERIEPMHNDLKGWRAQLMTLRTNAQGIRVWPFSSNGGGDLCFAYADAPTSPTYCLHEARAARTSSQ